MATKLVRKPTTTKTSVGKETVNQTVARAKAMLGSAYDPNTKAPSASRMKEISEQSFIKPEVKKAYDKSVSAMALANTETPTLPTPTVAQKPGLDMGVINAGLGQTDTTGMFQIPEMTMSETAGAGEKAAVDSVNALGQQIQGYLGLNKPEEGASEKALAKAREQAGVQAAQQEFNRYQNQINAITSQRDAQILSLEGQGRGQTQGFIGGEQARISREAAIMALPVQAQLAAAQGNLEQAKELMGQLYQAKSADIQADMTYRTNLVNSLISFASSSQQAVLQAKLADNAQASQIAQANLAYQRQLGLQALEYGQNNLITGISAIDPKSPTFEQDIAAYTSKLRKPVAAGSAPKPQNIGTSDNPIWAVYDSATNSFIPVEGAGNASTPVQAGKLIAGTEKIDTIDSILGSSAIDSVVGTSIFSRGAGTKGGVLGRVVAGGTGGALTGAAAGTVVPGLGTAIGAIGGGIVGAGLAALQGSKDTMTGDRQDLISSVEQLRQQLTLDKLTQAKAQGATFGALSDGERITLAAAATKLGTWAIKDGDDNVIGYNASEKSFKKEMDKIKYYSVLDYARNGGDPTLKGAIQAPDGTYGYVDIDGNVIPLLPY